MRITLLARERFGPLPNSMEVEVNSMFGLDPCAQALLKGLPRFHNACGQVRIQGCDGGAVVQLRVSGLPCAACPCFYRLCVEGGCGCPPIELTAVPAWQGEAALTCYTGGFSPDSMIRRRVSLTMSGGCGERVAEGVFRPCGCAEAEPCCRRPLRCAPCLPLYPRLSPFTFD